jgi:IS1 family transposase
LKTAEELKKKLSDFGVNYGSIATDDWDSFMDRIQERKPPCREEIYR